MVPAIYQRILRLALLAFCLLVVAEGAAYALPNDWHAVRIMPLVAWLDGHPLYISGDQGPALSTIYGPVMFLAYLPAAFFASADHYRWMILSGSLMSFIYLLAPMIVLLRAQRANHTTIAASMAVFAALAVISPPLRMAAFDLHADAPGLCLLALAAWQIGRQHSRNIAIGGLLCAAAAFSKQTYLLPSLGVCLYFAWFRQWRSLAMFLLALVLGGALMLFACLMVFGGHAFWDNVVRMPAAHPWRSINWLGEPTGGEASSFPMKLKAFWGAWVAYAKGYPVFLGMLILLAFRSRPATPDRNAASCVPRILACMGLAGIPAALMGFVKVGGFLNNLALPGYLALLAGLAFLSPPDRIKHHAWLVRGALIAMAILTPGLIFQGGWNNLTRPTTAETVIAMAEAAPGRYAYPRNPLTIYLAERRLTSHGTSLQDRVWAGKSNLSQTAWHGLSSEYPTLIIGSTKYLEPYLGNHRQIGTLPGKQIPVTLAPPPPDKSQSVSPMDDATSGG